MHTPASERPAYPERAQNGGVGAAAKTVAEHASAIAKLELELAGLELKKKVAALGVGIGMAQMLVKDQRGGETLAPASAGVVCGKCGKSVPPGKFCTSCGNELAAGPAPGAAAAFCTSCGSPLAPNAKFCGQCGTPR